MRLKRALTLLAVIVFLILCGVSLNFISENKSISQPKSNENQMLRVLAPYQSRLQQQILKEIAKDYENQAENVMVEIEFLNREEYKKEIAMRMDSGENVDLIICDGAIMPALIDMGVFQDMSRHITVEKKNSIRYQGLWDSVKSNGKYYGIPFTCDPYVLFYNKDILDKKELSLPQDWGELVTLSSNIQEYGSKGFGFPALTQDERTAFYSCMLYSMGGNYRNINREGGIQALDVIATLKTRKNIPRDIINWSKEDLAYAFVKGQVEMMANSLSSIGILRSTHMNFQPGITCLPGEIKTSCILMGENVGVTAQAASGAMDFLDYLYEPEVMERITYAMDTLPVLQNDHYRMKKIRPDDGEKLADIFLEEGYTIESHDAWFEISAAISDGVYKVLDPGTAESKEAISAEMHEKVKVSILEK